MKKSLLVLIPLLVLVPAIFVSGATIRSGEEPSIPKNETVNDDLYIAGGDVSILGNIRGDVIAAGGNLLLNGSISEDAIIVGGQIQVLSPVGDDLRMVGGSISVGERVTGDLVVAGGNIKLLSSGSVGGDVVIAGGRAVIEGPVSGNVRIWGDEVIINGPISGNVEIKGGEKVSLGSLAKIGGDLTYSAREEVNLDEGAIVAGEIVFNERKSSDKETKAAGFLLALGGALLLGKLLILLVTSIAVVLLFGNFAQSVVSDAIENIGRNGLLGLAVMVVTPIGLIILAVSFVGIIAAIAGGLLYGLIILTSKIFAGIIAGGFLSKWIKKQVIVDWKWTALGVLVLQIVGLVPLVGWLVAIVVFLISVGTLATIAYRQFWLSR